jgi:hypothetical protein
MQTFFGQNAAEVASESFDDGLVLINFLTGRYFTMNRSGELVWACLSSATTAETITDHVARTAGAERDRVSSDVEQFLETLKSERMVTVWRAEEGPTSSSNSMPPAPDALAYERPQLQIYDDLSDLILLDPVHEVNESLGWPVSRAEADRS